MILNEGNDRNYTPSHKSNHADNGKKNRIEITVQTIPHKMKVVPSAEKGQ